MKVRFAVPTLLTLALLAGCGKTTEQAPEPPASSAARDAPPAAENSGAAPAPSQTAAPLIKAASYPPRDECSALPGWPAFRARLEQAVAKRDADALVALTDPGVKLDFGGGGGLKDLRQRLTDKDYKLWDVLAALLPLGCAAQDGGATMPWIFARGPADGDPYSGMLVLGPAVPAYAKPDAGSPALGTLDWAFVEVAPFLTVTQPSAGKQTVVEDRGASASPFTKVILPGGSKTAFIETAKLRSLIDYRLLASRAKQGWRIDALVAGD